LTTAQEGEHISMLKLYACHMGGQGTSFHSDLNFHPYKIQVAQQPIDHGRGMLVNHRLQALMAGNLVIADIIL
jgi:hypothetical protein